MCTVDKNLKSMTDDSLHELQNKKHGFPLILILGDIFKIIILYLKLKYFIIGKNRQTLFFQGQKKIH